MMPLVRKPFRAAVALLKHGLPMIMVVAGAVACSGIEPRPVDLANDCRDCPPGLFSGEDGVITVYP